MKLIYLLPPSEGKNPWWENWAEILSFDFKKPFDIVVNATEKDLKCKWVRYEEGIKLNKNIEKSELLPAIERYSWVMYNAIDYSCMSQAWKKYFEENFKILSGMYGLVSPLDTIWNYKLPIETKWLYTFWWDTITKTLDSLETDYIIDMLPGSYAKMIDWKSLQTPYIHINFLTRKAWELKKISHGVKKVKWEYIYKLCESAVQDVRSLDWELQKISEKEYEINIIHL